MMELAKSTIRIPTPILSLLSAPALHAGCWYLVNRPVCGIQRNHNASDSDGTPYHATRSIRLPEHGHHHNKRPPDQVLCHAVVRQTEHENERIQAVRQLLV